MSEHQFLKKQDGGFLNLHHVQDIAFTGYSIVAIRYVDGRNETIEIFNEMKEESEIPLTAAEAYAAFTCLESTCDPIAHARGVKQESLGDPPAEERDVEGAWTADVPAPEPAPETSQAAAEAPKEPDVGTATPEQEAAMAAAADQEAEAMAAAEEKPRRKPTRSRRKPPSE